MDLGSEVKGTDKKVLQEKIETVINATAMDALTFYENKLFRISKENLINLISNSEHELFYVEHRRGVIEKVYYASKNSLKIFLQEQIFPERREGLDLTIMSADFACVFMTNHDGATFSVLL